MFFGAAPLLSLSLAPQLFRWLSAMCPHRLRTSCAHCPCCQLRLRAILRTRRCIRRSGPSPCRGGRPASRPAPRRHRSPGCRSCSRLCAGSSAGIMPQSLCWSASSFDSIVSSAASARSSSSPLCTFIDVDSTRARDHLYTKEHTALCIPRLSNNGIVKTS